ncbi:YihY/virulence factor BrkB family protein [Aureimonas flava]|uniref:YihY/virulence factor BrkB family protein n=1 Tax=Aureimonas flava TaxID=2320271 RepID=A0A3A1WHF0_9HYPH|nr:YihY/virulence factor BrkB family protein [Aureimonas flava]RIX98446.1 YihY/virulence factor BrkB family protein [Aureimonas flava]
MKSAARRPRRLRLQTGDIVVGAASLGLLGAIGLFASRSPPDDDDDDLRGDLGAGLGAGSAKGGFRDEGVGHADASAVMEGGRGRRAEHPGQIPARGWKDVLWRTVQEFSADRLMLVSAGVTFYVLLALFPAITAMVSIYGLFTDASNFGDQMRLLSGFLPGGAMDIISEQMARVASKGDAKLGFGLVFGLGLALWSANAGMKTLFDALNIVYEEEEKRSFVRLTLVSLFFTLCAIVFLILALAAVVVLPIALEFVGLGGVEPWLLFLRWPLLLAVVVGGLSIVYRYGPSRARARWRWVTPGAGLAALLWVIFSIAFSWYAQNFGNYDETYGSLGAAIGFMTWIWVSTMVVLVGAELDAELEHQTTHDSTTSPPRPMGRRGATMADTLGEAQG